MTEQGKKSSDAHLSLAARIGEKADRKLRARKLGQPAWFGLGMIGLIGWSVVVPTLLGAALGEWLDRTHPGALSWTLSLMIAGLAIGCVNAWYWMAQQGKAMRDELKDSDE